MGGDSGILVSQHRAHIMPRSCLQRSSFLLLATLITVATSAQGSFDTGNLLGTVNDKAGERMEGVAVVLEVDGAKHREAESDKSGRFRFRDLDPGNYVLRIRHDDYGEITYEPVNVRLGRTTTVQVQLSPRIQETIVVTSEPPGRAVEPTVGVRWEESDLERIPRSRDPFLSASRSSEAAESGDPSGDEGGAVGGASPSGPTYSVDGVPLGEGAPPAAVALTPLRGVEVTAGGGQVRSTAPGAVVDLLTRQRSDTLHASLDGWFGERQPGQGAEDVDQERILEVGELGLEAGGALWQDRLWGWGSLRRQWVRRQVVGGLQEEVEQNAGALELDAQLGRSTGRLAYHRGGEEGFGEGAGPDRGAETTRRILEPSRVARLELSHLFSGEAQLTGSWAQVRRHRQGIPLGANEVEPILGADGIWRGTFASLEEEQDADLFQLEAAFDRSRSKKRHEIRLGAMTRRVDSEQVERWGASDVLRLAGENFGTPFDILRVRRPADTRVERQHFALWAQDSIRRSRTTVDLGLRHDLQRGRNGASFVAANPLFPELLPAFDFGGDAREMSWNSTLPRLGLAHVFGDGKTVLRASFGMFASMLDADLVRRSHPALAELSLGVDDLDSGGLVDLIDSAVQLVDRGLDPRSTAGRQERSQIGLDPERTDEWRLSLERDLKIGDLRLEVVRRRTSDLLESRRLIRDADGNFRYAQAADYRLDQVLSGLLPDGAPYRIPVYSLRPGFEDTGNSLLLNGDRSQIWEAVTLRFDRRLARGLAVRSRVTWSDWRWQVGDEFLRYDDPTDAATGEFGGVSHADNDGDAVTAASSNAFLNSRWSFDVFVLYQVAPEKAWGFDLAASLHGREGFPIPYELATVTDDQTLLAVQATPRVDSFRLDDVVTLDLHLEKAFRIRDLRLIAALDAFNVLDSEGDLEREHRLGGPRADLVERTLSPRIFRVGFRLAWR